MFSVYIHHFLIIKNFCFKEKHLTALVANMKPHVESLSNSDFPTNKCRK